MKFLLPTLDHIIFNKPTHPWRLRSWWPLFVRLPPGAYAVDYTIPSAGHNRVFEDVLELDAEQVQRLWRASKSPMTVFWSGYSDPQSEATARDLEEWLNKQHPQYIHPVGIVLSVRPAAEMDSEHNPRLKEA